MKAALEHRVMWFLQYVNTALDGIHVFYRTDDADVSPSVKFEANLTSPYLHSAMWSPNQKFFDLIDEAAKAYLEIDFEDWNWNNTRTVFWFYPTSIKGELCKND